MISALHRQLQLLQSGFLHFRCGWRTGCWRLLDPDGSRRQPLLVGDPLLAGPNVDHGIRIVIRCVWRDLRQQIPLRLALALPLTSLAVAVPPFHAVEAAHAALRRICSTASTRRPIHRMTGTAMELPMALYRGPSGETPSVVASSREMFRYSAMSAISGGLIRQR